jgi:hypothetical protein
MQDDVQIVPVPPDRKCLELLPAYDQSEDFDYFTNSVMKPIQLCLGWRVSQNICGCQIHYV